MDDPKVGVEYVKTDMGWPHVVEVWYFDRSKGSTNIGVRKKTKPCKVESISVALKEISENKRGSLEDGQYENLEQISLSLLPQNFCKKDPNTGLQKQLRCQVCRCLMESPKALKCHLQSAKHAESFNAFNTDVDSTKFGAEDHKNTYTESNNEVAKQNSSYIQKGNLKRKDSNTTSKLGIGETKRAKLETKGEKNKIRTDRPGFGQDKYDETSYYFEPQKGLRKVYPYYFTFTTFTKGRWVGETILDIFSREFRAHSPEEYKRCIETGALTVNGKPVEPEYQLQHNDMIANVVHRHEVPVTSQLIKIVHMDSNLVVVDKPPSIPVHPCGRYRYNTIVYILAKELGLKFLKTIHRLDRLTSGLLLFGVTPQKAHEMEQQIRSRNVRKVYVCRVEGEFPIAPGINYKPCEIERIEMDESKRNMITCTMPIEVVSHKIGVCRVSPQGKQCRTDFERLSYNGQTSVVICRPHTGRMHQIRVHLQYLGYPIVNDPLYNSSAFGPSKGKGGDIGGKSYQQLIDDLIRLHNAENWVEFECDIQNENISSNSNLDGSSNVEEHEHETIEAPKETNTVSDLNDVTEHDAKSGNKEYANTIQYLNGHNENAYNDDKEGNVEQVKSEELSMGIGEIKDTQELSVGTGMGFNNGRNQDAVSNKKLLVETNQTLFDRNKLSVDKNCQECSVSFCDPKPEELVMYLHAYKYSGEGWSYETKLPEWANENWVESQVGQQC